MPFTSVQWQRVDPQWLPIIVNFSNDVICLSAVRSYDFASTI